MLSSRLLTTAAKPAPRPSPQNKNPVINPRTSMTRPCRRRAGVNYSGVHEQYWKPDEFTRRLEPLRVKANITDPAVPGEHSS